MSFEGVTAEEFVNLVDTVNPEAHWHWKGPVTSGGIPYMWLRKQAFRSYRVAWGLYREEPAAGMTLRRTCTDSECINPFHRECLEIGKHTRGARHGQAKLSETDILDIRDKYDQGGVKQSDLAKQHGVSQAQVSMIVNRKMWTHVE